MKKAKVGLLCLCLVLSYGSASFATPIAEYTQDSMIETCYPLPKAAAYRVYADRIECEISETALTDFINQTIKDGWIPLSKSNRSFKATLDDGFLSVVCNRYSADTKRCDISIIYRKICDLSHLPGAVDKEDVRKRIWTYIDEHAFYRQRLTEKSKIDYILEIGTQDAFDAIGVQVFFIHFDEPGVPSYYCVIRDDKFYPFRNLRSHTLADIDMDGTDEFILFSTLHLNGTSLVYMDVFKYGIKPSEEPSTKEELYVAYLGQWPSLYENYDIITVEQMDSKPHLFAGAYMDGILVPISEDYGEALPNEYNVIWGTEAFPSYFPPFEYSFKPR